MPIINARLRRLGRWGLLMVAAAFLAGCGTDTRSLYGQYFQALKQGLGGTFGTSKVTRAQAAAIPYASMGIALDGGAEAILVLATDTGGNLLWTASNHVVIQTTDGRITRTVGLPHDLGALTSPNADGTPPLLAAATKPFITRRLADFPDLGYFSVPLSCTTTGKGPQSISILAQAIRTLRVDEACHADSLHWSFVDNYWLDPQSGMVWRSLQHISPKGETVRTEIFRPPG